jgi:hypothetical protein
VEGGTVLLERLCKWSGSVEDEDCPAVYVDHDDPTTLVCQGPLLDEAGTAELLNRAPHEAGVALPSETLLRAAGLFLARQGVTGPLAEIEAYLTREAAL